VLSGETPHSEDHSGLNKINLPIQIAATGRDFFRLRVPVAGWAAFQYVGDIDLFTVQADGEQHGVKELPSGTDKGFSVPILLCARGLADNQPITGWGTDTEYDLLTTGMQGATMACECLGLERFPKGTALERIGLEDGVLRDLVVTLSGRPDLHAHG